MPNWVSTKLVIEGPAPELARFREAAKNGKDVLSFDSLYPMPAELEGTSSPVRVVSQAEYDEHKRKVAAGEYKGLELSCGGPITKEMSDRFIKEYGSDNWYDWKNSHYGTKWGLCDPYLEEDSEDRLVYSYQTAWSPATEGWLKVSADYPELLFMTFVEEESRSFIGRIDYQEGEVVLESLFSQTLPLEVIEAINEIAGMTQEEAIGKLSEYEDEFEYEDSVIQAIHRRIAGDTVEQVEDELKGLRL